MIGNSSMNECPKYTQNKKGRLCKNFVLGDSTYVKFMNKWRWVGPVVAEVKVCAFVAWGGAERTFQGDVDVYMIWLLVMHSQAEVH